MTEHAKSMYEIQGFKITDKVGRLINGVCQFEYKGYQVSISTIGVIDGGCPHPVAIFNGDDKSELITEVDTVQEAIEYIEDFF